MADQALTMLTASGLQALKAGGEVAKMATTEIERDAQHPELKAALQEGTKTAAQWAQRIQRALVETGSAEDVGNPVLNAHFETSRQIRRQAPDDRTRDIGIIAAGQLALNYWIASFGTMRAYAATLGLSQMEQDMQASLEEAKQSDQQHTSLAKKLLGAGEQQSMAT